MTATPAHLREAAPQAEPQTGPTPVRPGPWTAPRAWIARHQTWLAFAALALAVALTQLGSLTREVIDPDESSFILMGADVAAGHLPFVHAFDLKPPMIFLLLGGLFAVFGKSLVAVRLAGDLCLLATAMLIFLTARRSVGPAAALGGAMLYVAMASLEFGQPTYSELPAGAFLMAATWQLCRAPVTVRAAAGAGVLVALGVLTRTNLYPVAIAAGLLLLVAGHVRKAPPARFAWFAFGLGGLVPPALLVLAYALAGETATLKLAMIDAPLAYSGQIGVLEVLHSHIAQFYVWLTMAPLVLIPAVLLAAAGLATATWRIARSRDAALAWEIVVIALLAAAAAVGVLLSGAAYPHYWLQVLPFVALLAAFALAAAARLLRSAALAGLLVAVPLGSAIAARGPEAVALAAAPASYDDHYDIAAAARYIATTGPAHPRVWAWSKHLIHWYLDAPQLSRASVHPDNLARTATIGTLAAHGYVSRDEIGRLMQALPDIVVTDARGSGLAWLRAAGKPVDAWLASHYRLDARFGDVLVYRRVG